MFEENVEDLQQLIEGGNNINVYSDEENKVLSSDVSPYVLGLRRDNIEQEKEFNKFIRSCESLIRQSPEYKLWVEYIRATYNCHVCSLTGEQNHETRIDIHHHPFSLYSITKGVINKCIVNEDSFCSFDISTKVIELHYENRVGYIPIVRSLHEKFHNGFLQIPIEFIKGDWNFLHDNYLDYLSDDDTDVIKARMNINTKNCEWYNNVWKKNYYEPNSEDDK
jgi:hypothetical protein